MGVEPKFEAWPAQNGTLKKIELGALLRRECTAAERAPQRYIVARVWGFWPQLLLQKR